MSATDKQTVFKVIFLNQGQIYELYARKLYQSDMYGFVEIEELVFGEKSQLVVDPGEEKLKAEFEGVKRSYIPVAAIIRIDEVDREGVGKISDAKGQNIAAFPTSFTSPKGSGNKS